MKNSSPSRCHVHFCSDGAGSVQWLGPRVATVLFCAVLAAIMTGAVFATSSQDALTSAQCAQIDSAVNAVLTSTGAPGASIAVVWKGKIAYEHAYGFAKLDPPITTTGTMRYSVGSVTKQFVATAVLLLVEEKQLSVDDKVCRWFPELTRAKDISIRQLLSMTSGYQDYWPQDYVFAAMLQSTTPQSILDQWARKPLDFEPGTKWQYSNTNYIIAGLIVERVTGVPLFEYLTRRIFTPLGMTSVKDYDAGPLGSVDASGYLRNALGPLRPAPKEAKGWLFSAGQLAMTPHDLALWELSMIEQTVLQPASYQTMLTSVLLSNGVAPGYGFGIEVNSVSGRRKLSHGGGTSGYLAANDVYPDEQAAIIVLCNVLPGAGYPETEIANRIAKMLFESTDAEADKAQEQARRIFANLQEGQIDRALFSPNANSYFSPQVIADFASSLKPLGAPTLFEQVEQKLRGGMTFREFRIKCGRKNLKLTTRALPNGQMEQYLIERAE